MPNIKGNHKCPICGMLTTYTITDLNQQICDECHEIVSMGAPVVALRKELLRAQQVTRLVDEGENTLDHKGVFHPKSANDFERSIQLNINLLNMVKECTAMLSDNKLMVGDNKEETESYIAIAEDEIKQLITKYQKK